MPNNISKNQPGSQTNKTLNAESPKDKAGKLDHRKVSETDSLQKPPSIKQQDGSQVLIEKNRNVKPADSSSKTTGLTKEKDITEFPTVNETIESLIKIIDSAKNKKTENPKNQYKLRKKLLKYIPYAKEASINKTQKEQLEELSRNLAFRLDQAMIIDERKMSQTSKGDRLNLIDSRDLYITLIIAYSLLGQNKQAAECFDKGLDRLKNNNSVLENIDRLKKTTQLFPITIGPKLDF